MAITEWPSRFPVLNSGGGFHAVGEHLTALIGVDAKRTLGRTGYLDVYTVEGEIILFAVMSFIRNQYFLAKTDDGHRLLFRAKKCLIHVRYVLQVEGVASYKTRSSSCMLC